MRVVIRHRTNHARAPDYPKHFRDAFRRDLRRAGPELKKEFEKITANWEHQPTFHTFFRTWPDKMSMYCVVKGARGGKGGKATTADIWHFVSQGTKRHRIPRKGFAQLKFRYGGVYSPKTAPGGTWGGPGVTTGGEWRTFSWVDHPGIKEPRKFEEEIGKKFKRRFNIIVDNAIRRARRNARREAG